METTSKKPITTASSITLKAIIIAIMTFFLLIPGLMIQGLINERQKRSIETIKKINAKWSNAQTICGPVLSIPYIHTYKNSNDKTVQEAHTLYITPENLNIQTQLYPEERYYGIYKTILYKSDIHISGSFDKINRSPNDNYTIYWEKASLIIGISDLRGLTDNINFTFDGKQYAAKAEGRSNSLIGKTLVINLNDSSLLQTKQSLSFNCNLKLNGSSNINFIPIGKTSKVEIGGAWKSPGFIGNFSPEHSITDKGFAATWSILSFNRSIPETWVDDQIDSFGDSSFGVNLIEPVDHYQQNMRSAKYAIMFIALTFVVFFFVEILTKKKIHPIQYLLVGLALILFYSLLLSLSEQINFTWAYLIASFATIGLISAYAHSIFKNKIQTGTLTTVLCILYTFLFVTLQLEDIALLIGSIGLFIILGIIMYFSRKINWYRPEEEANSDNSK